jgi:hypothetical protein
MALIFGKINRKKGKAAQIWFTFQEQTMEAKVKSHAKPGRAHHYVNVKNGCDRTWLQ